LIPYQGLIKGGWGLTRNLDIFCICLIKQKFLVWYNHTFYFLCSLPFLRILKWIDSVYLKKRAKKGGVIKHKMCVLGKQKTLLLYTIGENHHLTRFEAVLWSRSPSLFHSPFNSKHKNAFIWVPWHFWNMLDKTKVSSMVKIHISLFYSPYPFCAYFERYMLYYNTRQKLRVGVI
jgi:hypothetical protein